MSIEKIAFIGFGEVGGIYAADLAAMGKDVVVYDRLLGDAAAKARMTEKAAAAKVRVVATAKEAVDGAELVIAAITASSALPVAKEVAPLLKPGQIYMDVNSVSPETKKAINEEIAKSGAEFVEAAVMAAVKPTRLKTPILMGGPKAAELAAELKAMGLETSAASDKIGVASAIKMCRSVVMKGLASLAIESLFTARRYGAEQAVLESFESTYPLGWLGKLPDTLVMRSVEHSKRRAAEMRESAETIRDAGMTPRMSVATAELQDWLTAEMEAGHYTFDPKAPFQWTEVADALNAAKR